LSIETGRQFVFPGLGFQQYQFENPDTIPENMKDGDLFYYLGSSFLDVEGYFRAPCSSRAGHRISYLVGTSFRSNDRILILEILKPRTF
jgi:hypothetical protein